jgi:hemolysin III
MIISLLQQVNDSGPIYKETVMGRFPVEPFNTASNLIFLASIIYFSLLISKSKKKHWFLAFCMPVFFAGFVGGTVYHASRSHEFWLLLDWVPIVILCLSCSLYFIFRSPVASWEKALLGLAIIGLNTIPRILPISKDYRNSLVYIATAVAVLLPVFLYAYRHKWKHFKYVVFTLLAFITAVSFRTIDKKFDVEFLYMGTHWLWHSFGGFAVFFLMRYIYLDNENSERFMIRKNLKND